MVGVVYSLDARPLEACGRHLDRVGVKLVSKPSKRVLSRFFFRLLSGLALVASCADNEVFPTLYLSISAEVTDPRIERLVVTLGEVVDGRFSKSPLQPAVAEFNLGTIDISASPFVVDVTSGTVRDAYLLIRGLAGPRTMASWSGVVRVSEKALVQVRLLAHHAECDADEDGFVSCQIDGCCPAGSATADCDDTPGTGATSSPLADVPSCVPCVAGGGAALDYNCDGKLDACEDDDGDLRANCEEAACGSQGDPLIYPGAPEVCDGKDNDCNGTTDDSAADLDGDKIADCVDPDRDGDADPNENDCGPDDKNIHHGAVEVCNQIDDDCDEDVDEDVADCGSWDGDWDGDGQLSSDGDDCNEYDSKVFRGSTYVGCCDPAVAAALTGAALASACDFDCDGTPTICDADDTDFDTFKDSSAKDCPPTSPDGEQVFKGAPEKCGDGVDQDCALGDISCDAGDDKDEDGYLADVDCNDADPAIHPWRAEVCDGVDQDCNGFIDDGNPGGGKACVNPEHPHGECLLELNQGVEVCSHGLLATLAPAAAKEQAKDKDVAVICVDYHVPPAAESACDGLDEDCDEAVDEDFEWIENHPAADGSEIVLGKGAQCGTGACVGGEVVCDPADPSKLWCSGLDQVSPEAEGGGVAQAFCDNVDNDCDGVVDGHSLPRDKTTCLQKGECLAHAAEIKTTCTAGTWVCAYDFASYDPEVEVRCDGKDNDCDGSADEDLVWSGLLFGQSCNGTGECGVGVVECTATAGATHATCSTNPDGSAWVASVEICDGKDNDCDGVADDGLVWIDELGASRPLGASCDGVGECGAGTVICSVAAGEAGNTTCSTNSDGTSPGVLIEVCDQKDNDCDGDTDDDVNYQGSVIGGPCDGVGECGAGVVVCSSEAEEPTCSTDVHGTAPATSPEICDHKDNDCDGTTDDGLTYADPVQGAVGLGGTCEGLGDCGPGQVVCSPTSKKATCSSNADGTAPEHKAEICDASDNDCNGVTDEGIAWTNPVTGAKVVLGASCQGVGKCGNGPAGVVQCSKLGNGTATCSTMPDGTAPRNTEELCNLLDDDCDGTVDDVAGIVAPDVTCKLEGLCNTQNVVATCDGDGEWQCNYVGVSQYEAVETTCDGLDNDCDGVVDEADTVLPPGNCNQQGVCAGLLEDCHGPSGWVCSYQSLPNYVVNETAGAHCDGLDNDCSGQTDEEFGTLGSSCTRGSGVCQNTGVMVCGADKNSAVCSVTGKPTSVTCNDGNLCSKNDQCSGGETSSCQGTPYTCTSDGLGCTTDACAGDGTCTYTLQANNCLVSGVCYTSGTLSPQSDCQTCVPATSTSSFTPRPSGTTCNDGDDCSNADKCDAVGNCSGSGSSCPDDGKDCTIDKCIGGGGPSVTCNYTSLKPSTCLIDGVCYSAAQPHPEDPCRICTPTSATTAWSPRANGTLCSDGNKCTLNDACASGQCKGDTNPCDDGEVCTTDSCSPANATIDGCAHVANSLACQDDGATCTNDVCAGTVCTHPIKAGSCFIASTCVATGAQNPDKQCESCQPSKSTSQWSDRPATDTCADGNACTTTDKCDGQGTCVGSGALGCDDSNPCTIDICIPPGGCNHFAQNGAACTADGLDCTTDVCDGSTCTHPLKANTCLVSGTCYEAGAGPAASPCKACIPGTTTTQLSNRPNGTSCDADGSGCTVNDTCTAGACVAGAAADCSAQADICNNPKCNSTGATSFNCGKQAKANNTACDSDGITCTSDVCTNGSCTHPVSTGCLISGLCVTEGSPDPTAECRSCQFAVNKTGYASKPNLTPCVGDGLACTESTCNGTGSCVNQSYAGGCIIDGACYANGTKKADNPCLVCDNTKNASAWSNVAAGVACTSDGKTCTDDLCDGSGSCQHTVKTDKCLVSDQCYDANAPNPANECQQCVPATTRTAFTSKIVGTPCTDVDGNACTVSTCNASAVCTSASVANGSPCNDSDACTFNDQCATGTCTGTAGQACAEDCRSCDGLGGCLIDDGKCFIGAACVLEGASQSTTADCMKCVPGTSKTNWTGVTGGVCYDFPGATDVTVAPAICRTGLCDAGACNGDIGPVAEVGAPLCGDAFDNDCDGLLNGADPDCPP